MIRRMMRADAAGMRCRITPAGFVAALFVLTGCGHRYGQPLPASTQGHRTLTLWREFIGAGAVVGVIVLGLILYAAVRFRRRDDAIPSQRSSNTRWEVVYTAVPFVIVAALFGLSVHTQIRNDRASTPDLTIQVTGFQWGWQFTYPDKGITVTGSGSAGEVPTLVLPVGRTVKLVLHTVDVVHSFWVPEFLTKRDLIPGVDNTLEITTSRVGHYDGHCAEYCLLDHWRMRFAVDVVPIDQFDASVATAAAATHGGPP